MKTCRHYRFQIPREDADELRAADPLPCPVCDNLPQRHFQTVDWSPRSMRIRRADLLPRLSHWMQSWFSAKDSVTHEPVVTAALN